jgi:hypothetical protein
MWLKKTASYFNARTPMLQLAADCERKALQAEAFERLEPEDI